MTSSTPGGYPSNITYGIHFTILVLNLVVIAALIWEVSPGTQSILSFYGAHNSGAVALITTIVATIYTVTLLVLTRLEKRVPPIVRICFDVVTCILYLAGGATIGFFMRKDFLWDVQYGNCNARTWTRQQCREFWYALVAVELVAMFFGVFCFILTVVDLILTVRVKRRQEQIKQEPQTGGYFAY